MKIKKLFGQVRELMVSEDASVDDDVQENSIVQSTVVENKAPDRSKTDSDKELLLKIEELNDAWSDLQIKRRNLYNQKNAMDKDVEALNKGKKEEQKKFRKLKSSKESTIFSLCFLVVFLAAVAGYFGHEYYNTRRSELFNSHNEKIKALDSSRDNLVQQVNNLQEDIKQQKITEQQTSLKEERASQGGLSDITDTVLAEENRKELDTHIAALKRHPTQRIQEKELDGVSYYEVVQKYDLEKYMLSDSGNPAVYPGAIVRGDSLMQGSAEYSLVSQERTPITLVCSRGGKSVRIENVSYGTVKEAVEQLWNESNSGYSEKWEYSLHSVTNEESLNMSLGVGVAGVGGIKLNSKQKESTSTIAITYTETYFSVAVEPLSSASQYFQLGTDLESLGNYEPAYVSSVDYGRKIIVLVTANLSESELGAELSANINGVDIGADIGYIKKNIDSSCKIYCYGGDSAKTLQAINYDEPSGGLKGWWDELINGKADDVSGFNQMIASDDSFINPVPLSYHLNYLSDNSSVPAIAILNDNIILKETARLVTLTLVGNKEGTFRLSDSANAIGYVVNTDQIQIDKKGQTSGEIQFIWDSSNPDSLTGFFNDSKFSYSLAKIPEGGYTSELAKKNGLSSKSTKLNINISNAIYEMP